MHTPSRPRIDKATVATAVCTFIKGRMEQMARDEQIAPDTVAAVSAGAVSAPVDYFALAHALEDARESDPETFENLATAYARASHLADPSLGTDVDESIMGEAERSLMHATDAAREFVQIALEKKDFQQLISGLAALREPIDRFFDDVMVMEQDMALRENRLRLLTASRRCLPVSPTWAPSPRRSSALRGMRNEEAPADGSGGLLVSNALGNPQLSDCRDKRLVRPADVGKLLPCSLHTASRCSYDRDRRAPYRHRGQISPCGSALGASRRDRSQKTTARSC